MSDPSVSFTNPVFLGYLAAFGGAALICFVAIFRARQIPSADIRRGLVALLGTSGGWAAATVGMLLISSPALKNVVYLGGLLIAFATVWAWLWFCSAYTGRSLHRDPTAQRVAVFIYLAVAGVKLTNPLHHLYHTFEPTTIPYPHLTIRHQLLYWVVTGLAYALVAGGYFMLFEFLTRNEGSTTPLGVLTGLTALPLVLNLVGYAEPVLLDTNHEPLGVAVFAVGVLFVYFRNFQAVQLTGDEDEPVLVLDEDDRIRDYNARAATLFPALSDSSVIGEPLDAMLPRFAETLDEDPPLFEVERDGRQRYYRVAESQFGTKGTPLGRFLLLNDVTDQKEYEEQLRKAKEQAEEANRLKTAMLANMSHELRTPLTTIDGYADLLKESLEGQPRVFAGKIHKGSQRLKNTLDSVLQLSELEAGTRTLERERIDLVEEVQDVTERLRSKAGEEGVELATRLPDASVRARLNEEAVHQILENLLDNAIKFTPEGGRVDVRVWERDRHVDVEVEDTGIGIDEEALSRIFNPFRQESEGMDREYEGTGLGLPIAKELTETLDGTISVDTEKGEGTRFTVRLPKAPGDA